MKKPSVRFTVITKDVVVGITSKIINVILRSTFRGLTGAPVIAVAPTDKDLIKKLEYWSSKNYPMTCNSKRKAGLVAASK